MGERAEALMRIVVGIVSGIILYFWMYLVGVLALVNFIWTIISGKRIRELADFCEIWNTQKYVFARYMIFESNERPMPFTKMTRSYSKFSR